MITWFSKKWRVPALGVLMVVIWLGPTSNGQAAEAGQEIFESMCTGCHTIGEGKLVGPDLMGVTSRRDAAWLKRQIKDPEGLLAAKDPIVLKLMKEADDTLMADLGLSDAEVTAVISFLKSTGGGKVSVGAPPQYKTPLIISVLLLIALTLIGLKAGSKNSDVR